MKTVKLGILVILAALFGIAVGVQAQPTSNSHEISGAGTFFRPLGSGSGTFNADATYGYHFDVPEWEVGLRQGYTLEMIEDAGDQWRAVTSPYINYNLIPASGPVVPYIGGFVGAVWNDEEFDGTAGPQGGVKLYLSDDAFVSANYRYEWFFDDFGDPNNRERENHVVSLGLGYLWGGSARNTR